MDKIIIRNLELYVSVGVSPAEREVGQRLVATIEVASDLSRAGQSDALADTVSYSDLARTVVSVATGMECQLLERMAEVIAQTLLERFPIEEVRLQLFKKPPPTEMMIEVAGVEILRRRGRGRV